MALFFVLLSGAYYADNRIGARDGTNGSRTEQIQTIETSEEEQIKDRTVFKPREYVKIIPK